MVTPPGIEPGLPPWKGDVLTAWPTGHVAQGFAKRWTAFLQAAIAARGCAAFSKTLWYGSGNWIRTGDTSGMNRML